MASIYKNKRLVYLSIISFFFFSNIGCLAPFLTSHMRYLGFSLPEVSFINALAAFASLLGPLAAGVIAERKKQYKSVSIFCIFVGAVCFCALSFVPKTERRLFKPLVDFSCKSGLRIERCGNWKSCHDGLPSANITKVHLSDCSYHCSKNGEVSSAHPLHICFHGQPGNICIVYDGESGNFTATEFITQLYKWPFDEDQVKSTSNATDAVPVGSHDVFDEVWLEEDKISSRELIRVDVPMCNYHPAGSISLNHKLYNSISCRPTFVDCDIHCEVKLSVDGVRVLPTSCEDAKYDPSKTFWSYLILRCLGDLCLTTSICLLDVLILKNTLDFEGAYARMHIWPAVGLAAFAPFSGALMDHFTDMDGKSDFAPCTFVAAGLSVLTCALIIVLPIYPKTSQFHCLTESEKPKKDSKKKTCSFELFVFVIILIVLGMQWSIVFTFLSWITTEIGCSGMLTGLGYTLIFGCCLPFLLISKNLIRNIGRANLIVFAFLFYGTRYAGVSFVFSPWWTLPFAAMGSFTLCIMWIAAVAYGQSLVPVKCHVFMQYVLHMLHFGIGRGLGSYIGGNLITEHGHRVVFRGVAVFSACLGFVFLAIYHLGFKRRKQPRRNVQTTNANGSWHPLEDQRQNGDTKGHQSILAELDDDSDITP